MPSVLRAYFFELLDLLFDDRLDLDVDDLSVSVFLLTLADFEFPLVVVVDEPLRSLVSSRF